MNNNPTKIVTIGEVLWDFLPSGKQLGGAPANFTYYANLLGAKSILISAIGNDAEGLELKHAIETIDIPSILTTNDKPTGSVIAKTDNSGQPQYTITEQVAWDYITLSDTTYRLANDTKVFCFGSLAQREITTRHAIHDFINLIPPKNEALIVFDINLRQNFWNKEIIESSLRACNILKMNEEEIATVCSVLQLKTSSHSDACLKIMDLYNIEIIILTLGKNGSIIYTRENICREKAEEVRVTDTIGAGDAFTAAFVVSLMQGKSIEDAQHIATLTSAKVCTQNGAIPYSNS